MANNAHFIVARQGGAPHLIVRDDRGTPVTVLELPDETTEPAQAEQHLRDAGWDRSSDADWAESDDGWVVPVLPV